MIPRSVSAFLFAGLLAAGGMVAGAGEARADCASVPGVPWWNAQTHKAISQEVEDRYSGDWVLYENVWRQFLARLETLRREGAAVRIGGEGTVLRDESLRRHIGDIKRRISVIGCLARTRAAADPDVRYAAFETASGPWAPATDAADPPATRIETDSALQVASTGAQKIKIVTRCRAGTTEFRITNLGPKWPGLANFLVHRRGDDALLSQRRLRMGQGQTVSFNIQDTAGDGVIDLRVVPSWSPEDARHAVAKCS